MTETRKPDHNEQLTFLCRLLHETIGISFYFFDEHMNIVSSETDREAYMRNLFLLNCGQDLRKVPDGEAALPLLYSDAFHLNWILQPLDEGSMLLLGPVFESDFTNMVFQKKMGFQQMSVSSRARFLRMVRDIPVIPLLQFAKYAEMVYACLYPKQHDRSSFQLLPQTLEKEAVDSYSDFGAEDRRIRDIPISHGSRETELAMLRSVREGNLNPINSTEKNTVVGMLAPGDPLRQIKNLVITQVALVSRAAIEGGMDYELSYTLSDFLIQRIELCETPAEVYSIAGEVVERYTNEVRKAKEKKYSPMVHYICTYISKHVPGQVRLEDIAEELGYEKYYLSRVFHEETGKTVRQYTTEVQINRAKEWLKNSTMQLQEISDRLGFSSPAHFSAVFKKEAGCRPSDYKTRN